MPPFTHQVQVKFGELEWKRVGIMSNGHFTVLRTEANLVGRRIWRQFSDAGQQRFEKTFGTKFARWNWIGVRSQQDLTFHRARLKEAHDPTASFRGLKRVRSKYAKRVGVTCG